MSDLILSPQTKSHCHCKDSLKAELEERQMSHSLGRIRLSQSLFPVYLDLETRVENRME